MMPFAITLPLLTTNLLFCEKNDDFAYDRIVENTLNTTNYVNGKNNVIF